VATPSATFPHPSRCVTIFALGLWHPALLSVRASPRRGAPTTAGAPSPPPVVFAVALTDSLPLAKPARFGHDAAMFSGRLVVLSLFLTVIPAIRAQSPPASPPTSPTGAPEPKLDYPDSPSGLEHLAKDIIKAQRTNDGARAAVLLKSLVLIEPRDWYDQVFGGDVAEESETLYEKSAASIAPTLANFFLNATAQDLAEVRVVRFDKSCDDNAGEDVFGILHARLQPVPLYELRLLNGNKFVRLFAFAFVDGGFRFIITPKMDGRVFHRDSSGDRAAPQATSAEKAKASAPRLKVGGAVQAAKLTHRVQPTYPDVAREEHLEGTVRLHALLGKDGSLRQVYVIKGYCSLADSAVRAVAQWRYVPTLFNGEPIEVDTEIDVTYSLSH